MNDPSVLMTRLKVCPKTFVMMLIKNPIWNSCRHQGEHINNHSDDAGCQPNAKSREYESTSLKIPTMSYRL